jgi:DNA-binding HxlR family transcriptional regulator
MKDRFLHSIEPAPGSKNELVAVVSRWKAVSMRSYGQYCPIARASELLAERWSIIILRNIVILGCRTFNEIADGAPGLSRGLLSKRLRELERAGVIKIRRKPDGPHSPMAPSTSSSSKPPPSPRRFQPSPSSPWAGP